MGTSQSVEVPSSPSASEHVSSTEIGTHGDPRTPLAPPTRPQPVEALLSLWAVAAVERNKRVAAAWRLPHMPARAPETADTRRAFPGRRPVLSCLLDLDPTYIGIPVVRGRTPSVYARLPTPRHHLWNTRAIYLIGTTQTDCCSRRIASAYSRVHFSRQLLAT